MGTTMSGKSGNLGKVVAFAALLCAGTAHATPQPPAWGDMQQDAKGAFSRHSDGATLMKIARKGEPRRAGRRTPTEIVPELYQDVDVVYQTRRWKQVERTTMTLHYESGLGGWSFVGFEWGNDVQIVRPGNYPPAPPPPNAQDVADAVKQGLRDWHVRPADVEKVEVAKKGGTFSWLDDVPTAGYAVDVRASIRDVIDRNATYGARYKTRFVCTFKAQLALEDGVSWTMQSTIPDCATEGCTLSRMCKDTWGGRR